MDIFRRCLEIECTGTATSNIANRFIRSPFSRLRMLGRLGEQRRIEMICNAGLEPSQPDWEVHHTTEDGFNGGGCLVIRNGSRKAGVFRWVCLCFRVPAVFMATRTTRASCHGCCASTMREVVKSPVKLQMIDLPLRHMEESEPFHLAPNVGRVHQGSHRLETYYACIVSDTPTMPNRLFACDLKLGPKETELSIMYALKATSIVTETSAICLDMEESNPSRSGIRFVFQMDVLDVVEKNKRKSGSRIDHEISGMYNINSTNA